MKGSVFAAELMTVLGTGLAVSLATPAGAHQGPMVYPIYELPTADRPDLHDGTLEDWEAVLPGASLDHNDFVYDGNLESAVDAEDLAFRVFLAWHGASQRIYMGIEVIDDVYLSTGNGWTELMIDGDHSGGQVWFSEEDGYSREEVLRLYNSQAQNYLARPETIEGQPLRTAAFLAWTVELPWSDIGGFQHGEAPNLSVVELAITPWDDLDWDGPKVSKRSVLESGKDRRFVD
jgi:hypothetical protein